jgi:polysaccharide biosynthesis protein VpsQ
MVYLDLLMSYLIARRCYSLVAFTAFFVFILWIIYSADTGEDNVFINLVHRIPFGDKLGHVGLYGGLAFLLNRVLEAKAWRLWGWNLQLGSVLVFGFAVLEEISQGWFDTRNLDGWDVFADFVGVLSASVLTSRKVDK